MAIDPAEVRARYSLYVLDDDRSPYPQMNHDTRQALLPSLEHYLSYLLTQELADIQEAVRCVQEVSDSASPDPQAAAFILWHLGRSLLRRFQHTKQADDITQAIDLLRSGALQTDDDSLRQKCFSYLSIAYMERDGNPDGFPELNRPPVESQSITWARRGPLLETFTHNLDEDVEVLFYFGISSLAAEYKIPRDVDSEIQLSIRAMNFSAYYPAVAADTVFKLGQLLMIRYKGREIPRSSGESRKVGDIYGAIDCFRTALKMESRPEKLVKCLLGACDACHLRFRLEGKQNDLEDAIGFSKLAEDIMPVESRHGHFPVLLFLQSSLMGSRYESTGDLDHLDAAIEYSSRAINSKEIEVHPVMFRCALLTLHAGQLLLRFSTSDRSEDLKEAIRAAQLAVDLAPPKHPDLVGFLTFLSLYKLEHFSLLLDSNSLEQGLRHIREAESIGKEIPEALRIAGHAGMDVIWANLLSRYSERSLEEKELDTAIAIMRDGMTHFFAIGVQFRLMFSASLFKRWKKTGNKSDIDEAINVDRQVIELGKTNPAQSAFVRRSLGQYLYSRHVSTGDSKDLQEALAVSLEGFWMAAGDASLRMGAGQMAMRIFCRLKDWASARKMTLEILDLFVILNGRALNWQDKQNWLREFASSASTYASIALEAGCDVIQVIDTMERCRGAILGQLIDINDLAKVAPDKAQHFRNLQNEMNTGIDLSGMTNTHATQTSRRIQVEAEIRDFSAKIRTLKGFQNFLLGPTEDDLKVAAARGHIIIINTTEIRSDAIIITKDDSTILRLPGLKFQKVVEYFNADLTNVCITNSARKNRTYRELQKWLWDNCVKLILEKLDSPALTGGLQRHRVCWMGIGIASSLPFHAAGSYIKSTKGTALSRIISSYTSTLKVLIYGQRQLRNISSKPKLQAQSSKTRLAVVSMQHTPGMPRLEGVRREAEEILKITQGIFSTRDLPQPSAADTMEHMAECEIVHFACHGESTLPDLSSSHLVLQTLTSGSIVPVVDKLTLKDVVDFNLICGKLAFLSACSTAQDRSPNLLDEALHLVSGFQVAGYLHAIGNRWPSDDEVSVEVVKGFYRNLVAAGEFGNGENVAEALNGALQEVTRKYAKQPVCWAQFVHFGVI